MKKIKTLFSTLLVLLLALGLASPALGDKNKADRRAEGNLFKLTTVEDFSLGELEGLVIDETVGNGALKLAQGTATGTFVSDVIGVEPFEYLVASWNADMPQGAKLEVLVRAYVEMHKEWTSWMSWGQWSADIRRGSADSEDALAFMDVDTLTINGSAGETGTLVQMKAVLTAAPDGASPVLRQLACTYKNTIEGQDIKPLFYGEAIELPASAVLDTPAYSQMIREQSISNVMCSATTICVLLNDRGEDVLPEEIALVDYDKSYEGFGNWSYSVAAAGAFGYDAYCQFGDADLLRQELAHGYSVGIGVQYSSSPSGSYPYLENAPIGSTGGHLITITGYETIDGVDYFYSSDSAASMDAACLVRYRADQLMNCNRSKMMYIVHDKEDVTTFLPNRIAAELVPADGVANGYKLMAGGEQVVLDASFVGKMLRGEGGGVVACYIEEEVSAMPSGVKITTANRRFLYSISAKDGLLIIAPDRLLRGVTGAGTAHIFVMMNNGVTYETTLLLEPAAAATPEATAAPTPEATEAVAPVATPTAAPEPAPAPGNRALIIALAAVGVIVVAVILLVVMGKKRRR